MNQDSYYPASVIELDENSRGRFIARTYTHLVGAILAFTFLEILLFKSGMAERMAGVMLGAPWLVILGAFMVVSWLARSVAHSTASPALQYLALGGFVVAQAIIFVPLLVLADNFAPGAIGSAAVITITAFLALSLLVFVTRKDFSFLRGILMWGGIVALVLIIGGALFGFNLGTYFSVAMVALAGAAILYDTSNILHHYSEDRHVAAALELFASIALMFWYVLRLVMSRR